MQLASDNFTRADAATLGANWSTAQGSTNSLKVASNQAALTDANAYNGNRYSAITWPNDQYCQADVVTLASAVHAVCVRMITSGVTQTYYAGGNAPNEFGGGTTYRVWKIIAGTLTSLGTGGTGAASGQTWYLEAKGTNLNFKVGGVSKISTTDASITAGQAGIIAENSAASLAVFDNWLGGNFITSIPQIIMPPES